MSASSSLRTDKKRTSLSGKPTLEHVYIFDNDRESQTSSLNAALVKDENPGTKKVEYSVEEGLGIGERNSNDAVEELLDHIDLSDNKSNPNIRLQLCRDKNARVPDANHEKKQFTSNLPGEPRLPVPHKVNTSHLDHVFCPIPQHSSGNVLQLPGSPTSNSSAIPGSGIPLDQTKTPYTVLDNDHETRDHGSVRAEHQNDHFTITSSGSDSSAMFSGLGEPIASAKDIGMPTVVDIPADAKSVAILKTIKADKIKRAGSTTTSIPEGTSKKMKAEKVKRAGPCAISIPQGTSRDFQTICAEWGIETEVLFTFQNAIDGLFGKALTSALTASSSILGQISHLCVLPEKSSLVMFRNAPFRWISSTLLEFQIPEETLIQYGGETIIIISANIRIDYSNDGTFTVLLSANRLGDDDRTWSWSESNVGLLARFQYEQELLPVTLSHTGRNGKRIVY